LTTSIPDYADEIRDYLIGRLSKDRSIGLANPLDRDGLLSAPILDWWIFEGKRYRGLKGPLAHEWVTIDRQIRRLLASYNPRYRMVDLPEGEVDWLATALHMATTQRLEFKCRVTHIGLSDDELAALRGWQGWIALRWRSYVEQLGEPVGCQRPSFDPAVAVPSVRTLRRWAYTARRSRWPLLRSIVAESLRCLFETEDIERLPVPEDSAVLFELVCMVRVLRFFEPRPRVIRWLHAEIADNTIQVPGISCSFQRTLPREELLRTSEFDAPLRQAVEAFQVRVPSRLDVLLEFDRPRAGFKGILIEAKSGEQVSDAALWQLKCYRAVLNAQGVQPLLIWGLAEQGAPWVALSRAGSDVTQDRWLFSRGDSIRQALTELFGVQGAQGRGSGRAREQHHGDPDPANMDVP
jgi:hypothetical protein